MLTFLQNCNRELESLWYLQESQGSWAASKCNFSILPWSKNYVLNCVVTTRAYCCMIPIFLLSRSEHDLSRILENHVHSMRDSGFWHSILQELRCNHIFPTLHFTKNTHPQHSLWKPQDHFISSLRSPQALNLQALQGSRVIDTGSVPLHDRFPVSTSITVMYLVT